MDLYVECSALVAWLFGQPTADRVAYHVSEADLVYTSALTFLESRRAIIRALQAQTVDVQTAATLTDAVGHLALEWHIIAVHSGIVGRASRPFTMEPVRSLDAIHLATIAQIAEERTSLAVLSNDHRVRQNIQGIGSGVFVVD